MKEIDRHIDRRNEDGMEMKRRLAAQIADNHRLLNKECHDGTKHMRLGYINWYECTCGFKLEYTW